MSIWKLGTRALHVLDPETAHRATISALKSGIGPRFNPARFPRLAVNVAGLSLPNPLGLAAGFDKNAEVPDACLRMGFGFVEVGAVTPRPQSGNSKPRVFRLPADKAVINRYGFNNDGLEVIGQRLGARNSPIGCVGVNLGANKDSDDREQDYVTGAERLSPGVSFCTVNVSSPNTPGLRSLQDKQSLVSLLRKTRAAMTEGTSLFLKIAPDLTDEDCADIAAAVAEENVDALIVSNTTIARPDTLRSDIDEAGGLSGAPLFHPSTARLREFARLLDERVPLVGVGGIGSPDQAYQKITSGASLLQLYSALVYEGPELVGRILEGLEERLAIDGYDNALDAVGVAV